MAQLFFAMAASSAGFDSSPSIEQILDWELLDGFSFPNGSIFDRLKENNLQCRLYNDFHDQFSSNPDPIGGQFAIASALKGVDTFDVHHFKNFPDDLKGDYPYQFTFIERIMEIS